MSLKWLLPFKCSWHYTVFCGLFAVISLECGCPVYSAFITHLHGLFFSYLLECCLFYIVLDYCFPLICLPLMFCVVAFIFSLWSALSFLSFVSFVCVLFILCFPVCSMSSVEAFCLPCIHVYFIDSKLM